MNRPLLKFIGALLIALPVSHANAQYKESVEHGSGSIIADEGVREDIGDIREVKKEPFKPKFRSRATLAGTYTTNAELLGNHSSSDFLFSPVIEGGMNIPLGHGLDLDLVARIESMTYGANSSNNFWGLSGAATLSYRVNSRLPRVFVGAEPYTYWQWDMDRISSAVALTAGIDDSYVFNHGRSQIFGGYQFYHYFADPSRDNRNAHQFTIGLAHQFRQNLIGQVFYAFRFTEFPDHKDFKFDERSDVRNVFGVSAVYRISENLYGSVTGTFVDNNSTDDQLYTYQSAGLTLGFTWNF